MLYYWLYYQFCLVPSSSSTLYYRLYYQFCFVSFFFDYVVLPVVLSILFCFLLPRFRREHGVIFRVFREVLQLSPIIASDDWCWEVLARQKTLCIFQQSVLHVREHFRSQNIFDIVVINRKEKLGRNTLLHGRRRLHENARNRSFFDERLFAVPALYPPTEVRNVHL